MIEAKKKIKTIILLVSMLIASQSQESEVFAKPMDLGTKIPRSVEESVIQLKAVLSQKMLTDIKSLPEDGIWRFNSSLGAEMRNTWFYGHSKEPLAAFFFSKGIHHPDHMSGIILRALWSDLNGVPFDLEKQADKAKLGELRSRDIVKEIVEIPKELTSAELTTSTGETITIDDQRGMVTILAFVNAVNMYNSNEIELLNQLETKYRRHGLKIIAFFMKNANDPEQPFAKYQMNFPFVEKPPLGFVRKLTQTLTAPAAIYLPCNALLDKEGRMVYRIGGWNDSTMKNLSDEINSHIP